MKAVSLGWAENVPIASSEVTTLNHKSLNNPVEGGAYQTSQ